MKFLMYSLCLVLLGFGFYSLLKQGDSHDALVDIQRKKIVYRHVFQRSVNSLDPLDASDIYTQNLVSSIYDRLYEYKYLERPYDLKPNIAEGFPEVSQDRLTYTIRLKPDLFFDDNPCFPGGKGRELTAHDFVYSIKRHFDPKSISTSSWLWKNRIVGLDEWQGFEMNDEIKGLKALNKRTIQIILTKPFPQFVHTLAMAFTVVLPWEAVSYYKKELARNPVGSGPWRLKSFHSKKVILEKNPNYRSEIFHVTDHLNLGSSQIGDLSSLEGKKLPLCDEIEVDFITSTSTAWMSFLKGDEVNYARLPSAMSPSVFDANEVSKLLPSYEKKYSSYSELAFGLQFFGFNMSDPTLGFHPDPLRNERNKALRKAIRYALNWSELIERRFSNRGELFPGVVPPSMEGFSSHLARESITYNPQKARGLLESYGWNEENLPVLTFSGISQMTTLQNFEQFRKWLVDIGYPKDKVQNRVYLSFQEMFKDIMEAKLPSFGYITWHIDIPDAFDLFQLFHSQNKAPGMNVFNYENNKFDQILDELSSLEYGERRNKLIKKANEIIIEDCPLISGFSNHDIHMWHKEFLMLPSSYLNYFKYVTRKS